MDPDAVHDPEAKHDHQNERAAVTNQRQRNARNREHRDGHPDVLKNVGKNERSHPGDEKEPKLVARKKGDKETREQEKGERSDQEDTSDKAPLFSDGGENVIVMHGRGGQETELDLGVRRFETFAGPAA